MGGLERGEDDYYRVQGSTFVIEYENTQSNANHIHCVWRDSRAAGRERPRTKCFEAPILYEADFEQGAESQVLFARTGQGSILTPGSRIWPFMSIVYLYVLSLLARTLRRTSPE
jgi:Protein of unknown function (DUF3500)